MTIDDELQHLVVSEPIGVRGIYEDWYIPMPGTARAREIWEKTALIFGGEYSRSCWEFVYPPEAEAS